MVESDQHIKHDERAGKIPLSNDYRAESQLSLGDNKIPSTLLPPSTTEGVRWLLSSFVQIKKLRLVTQEMIVEPKV